MVPDTVSSVTKVQIKFIPIFQPFKNNVAKYMLIYVLEDVRVRLGAKPKTVDKMTLANANPIVTLQYKDENSNEKVRHVYMKKEDVGFNKTQGILCSL